MGQASWRERKRHGHFCLPTPNLPGAIWRVFEGLAGGSCILQPAIIVLPFYNGSAEEGKKKFDLFYKVGPVADMTREMPYDELNSLQVCADSIDTRVATDTTLEPHSHVRRQKVSQGCPIDVHRSERHCAII